MASGSADAELYNQLNTLSQVGVVGDLTDGQLVQRFMTARDDSARAVMTVLVERHGPMILRTCQQVLGDSEDAEDAFQATFLVLARKAGSIRKADSAAGWLHGVALRVAARARADAVRRRVRERRAAAVKAGGANREPGPDESWPELHEEIARLPERYREPVVLCYLEGLSTEAAAVRIGCPRGTVLSRLSRARERLRGSLIRRGLALAAGPLAAPPSTGAAITTLPAGLLETTVKASLGFASRRATGTAVASSTATTLARGVLHAMTLSKLKVLGMSLLVSLLALGGARSLAVPLGGSDQTGPVEGPADRQATESRSVTKLQERLDQAERHNRELNKELEDVRAELKALELKPLRKTPADIPRKAVENRQPPRPENLFGLRSPWNDARGPEAPAARPGEPAAFRIQNLIFVTSPQGDRIVAFDTRTKQAHSFPTPGTTSGSPVEITPVSGRNRDVVALLLKGPRITRIAAMNLTKGDGNWSVQDLREAVAGEASPIVGPGCAFYILGKYVYAFSVRSHQWAVVELPEGARLSADNVGGGTLSFEGGGHILTFHVESGEWSDLDLKAILNTPSDRDKVPAGSPK